MSVWNIDVITIIFIRCTHGLFVARIVESFEDVLQIAVEQESFFIQGERITIDAKKVRSPQ